MWWKIITNGATIADLARQVFNSFNKDKAANPGHSSDIRDVLYRLDYLEKNEVRQAELIKRMADQLNDVSGKVRTATILAIVSFILAAISIGVQLLDK